jgi:signal transduction histidine kinase
MVLNGGSTQTTQNEVFWHKNGQSIQVEYVTTAIRENGTITGSVVVFRDVSDRAHLEAITRQSEKMAAIGQLAAGVAHELNNPLSVILGFAQSLIRRITHTDPTSLPLLSIERESLRCRTLVQNLLIFSREHKPGFSPEDPVGVIKSALMLIETQTRVKKINIVTEFPTEAPTVQMDGNQLQQVIINLCTNAIDAMPAGGTLTIGFQCHNDAVEIRVADTGTGIPAEIQAKIWEPFFTTKEVGKGTGLGLSLIYEIIKKHNGRIDLQSELGKGTVFIIHLPLTQNAAVPSTTAKAA